MRLKKTILYWLLLPAILSGCQAWHPQQQRYTLLEEQGRRPIKGLADTVSIRRSASGVPFIAARNCHDTLFTLGFVHAADRLNQMVRMRLLAQGRLAEIDGLPALASDRFMRNINLQAQAEQLYSAASPQTKHTLDIYARGVNAFIYRYRNKLPAGLANTGYQPEYWKAEDSALLLALFNFNLSGNLNEEVAALLFAQQLPNDQLAWLFPVYPDESLPLTETEKLHDLTLKGALPGIEELAETLRQFNDDGFFGNMTANSWAVSPLRSRNGKTLFAIDLHAPTILPSLWSPAHLQCPGYQVAGTTIAGIPGFMAGFNGRLAWGMTKAMSDTQDLYLERLRQVDNRLYYFSEGQWLPTSTQEETFYIRGQQPRHEIRHSTRHGPLLNGVIPSSLETDTYGIAYHSATNEADQTLDAFFELPHAQTIDQAFGAARNIRSISANLLFADANHIAWQTMGRFPERNGNRGGLPSPGWNNDFDSPHYVEPALHPWDQDPQNGWLICANQRTIRPEYGIRLSNGWQSPERAERIGKMLAERPLHDSQSMIDIQQDQTSEFVYKLQAMLNSPALAEPLSRAIKSLPGRDRRAAQEAVRRLQAFNGALSPDNSDAALYAAFLQTFTRQTFLDELGPENGPAWNAFIHLNQTAYAAPLDHLLGREDSPYWDDRSTPEQEDKATILARSLVEAIRLCEKDLGENRHDWQWGKQHRQNWQNIAFSTKKADNGGNPQGFASGGDNSTINLSSYVLGKDFTVQSIPTTRLVINFALEDPLLIQNAAGQSGNPASSHYGDSRLINDGNGYLSVPFQDKNKQRRYGTNHLLLIPEP